MIVRINYRESFSRTVGYVMKRDKAPELVGGNLSAKAPNAMIGEFGLIAALNTRCKKPVAHLSFSLSQGEHLEAAQWAELAERVAADYGFEQYTAIRHHDTDCEHIHIIGNRIKLDGKAVATSNDRHRMRTLCQQAEKDFGLVKTALRSPNIRVNKDELERAERLYRQGRKPHPVPSKLMLSEQVKATATLAKSRADFTDRCKRQGISVRWRPDENGKPCGVSFSEADSRVFFSGSSLGIPLSHLNHTLKHNGKTHDINDRRPDTRLDRGLHPTTGSRAATTFTGTGRTLVAVGGTDAATQQEFGNAVRSAAYPSGNVARSPSEAEKKILIAATTLVLGAAVWKLLEGLEGIDDALSPPPSYRVQSERGLFR